MDCKKARKILLNNTETTVSASERQEADRHIAVCHACRAGITSLAAAIKEQEQTCAMVQEVLPIYIEEELAKIPVNFKYPHIWQHLLTCSFCVEVHSELSELLRCEREQKWIDPAAYPACTLPFFAPSESSNRPLAWTIENLREMQGYLSTVITFSKAYITNTLNPQTPAWARSSEHSIAMTTHFPLMDSLLEDDSWLVSMELLSEQEQPTDVDRWHLRVILTGSVSPTGIQIFMKDNGEERTIVLDESGKALFRNVSLAWLKRQDSNISDDGLKIKIWRVSI